MGENNDGDPKQKSETWIRFYINIYDPFRFYKQVLYSNTKNINLCVPNKTYFLLFYNVGLLLLA